MLKPIEAISKYLGIAYSSRLHAKLPRDNSGHSRTHDSAQLRHGRRCDYESLRFASANSAAAALVDG